MDATREQWRPVVGWECYYEVSNFGRIRSLPRTVLRRYFPPRIKTLPLNRDGYQLVAFQARPRSTTMKVHTVVLTAFVGPRPKGMQACHNDGNPANNSLTNLRWDTPLSNIADAIRQKTHPSVAMKARGNCIRGHEYTEATTYVTPRGTRECRRCRNDQARIRRTRKRAAMNRQLE